MTHIEVFDPPMCCSTGVCGPSVDPLLAAFAADVEWLTAQGVTIARHNLSQNPQPFVSNTRVLDLMQREGTSCLPIVIVTSHVLQGEKRKHLADAFAILSKQDLSRTTLAPVVQAAARKDENDGVSAPPIPL